MVVLKRIEQGIRQMITKARFDGVAQLAALLKIGLKELSSEEISDPRVRRGKVRLAIQPQAESVEVGRTETDPAIDIQRFDV
jgi:hypothetical protein